MKTKKKHFGMELVIMAVIIVLEIAAIIWANNRPEEKPAATMETVSAEISAEDMRSILENAPEGVFSINEEYKKLLIERESAATAAKMAVVEIVTTVESNEAETQQQKPDPAQYKGIELSEEEFAEFCRMVEAEVTGDSPDDFKGRPTELQIWWAKLRCARCILNRLASSEFPNDMHSVLFQKGQFAPVSDGRYWDVSVCDMTRNACRAALDATQHDDVPGVMYFRIGRWSSRTATQSFIKTDALGISYYAEI